VAIIVGAQFIIDAMLNGLIPMAFYMEQFVNTSGFGANLDFSPLFSLFFGFGVSLIVLKFLYKGFNVYIGWSDGDPDLDPLSLVTNFLRAMAVALCFSILYDALVTVTSSMIDQTIGVIGDLYAQQSVVDTIVNLISGSIFMALTALILIVCYLILWIQFMMRGVEMFVMRVGVPIACVGLIDNDKGVFAPYVKKFFMNAATVLIQIALVKLSFTIATLGNLFYALGVAFVAMKTPKFLQEFMLQAGGAGGSVVNTIYHASRLYQMAKVAVKK
jgi:hypothetical protein